MDWTQRPQPSIGAVLVAWRGRARRTVPVVLVLAPLAGCSDTSVHRRKARDRLPDDLASSITPPPGEPLALVRTALAREPRDPMGSIEACREAALRALPYVVIEGVSPRVEPAAGLGA